jgi:energy-coupling factor transporter transmembrane protein EcfT
MSAKQLTDAGMALVLILLLLAYFTACLPFFYLAIPALIITMAFPPLLYPFAKAWFAFSSLLGRFVSSFLLTIIFFLLVLPVAVFRRMAGRDRLQLRQYNRSERSAFHRRDHLFTKEDMERPF